MFIIKHYAIELQQNFKIIAYLKTNLMGIFTLLPKFQYLLYVFS